MDILLGKYFTEAIDRRKTEKYDSFVICWNTLFDALEIESKDKSSSGDAYHHEKSNEKRKSVLPVKAEPQMFLYWNMDLWNIDTVKCMVQKLHNLNNKCKFGINLYNNCFFFYIEEQLIYNFALGRLARDHSHQLKNIPILYRFLMK